MGCDAMDEKKSIVVTSKFYGLYFSFVKFIENIQTAIVPWNDGCFCLPLYIILT